MTPWVRRLLFANIAIFFVQLTMPALADGFAFVPTLALVRPWTIITYMFLHGNFMHIAFNMMALYFFGPAVEELIDPRPACGHETSERAPTSWCETDPVGALVTRVLGPDHETEPFELLELPRHRRRVD